MSKATFKRIRLEFIDRPKDIHRMSIDEDELNELAESIRENGLLQPICVAPRGERYLIIFGDRRYLAHHKLGKKDIECKIKDVNDIQIILDRGIENLQRVNLTAFEEGHIYLGLQEKAKMTLEQLSKRFGKSPATIQRRMDVLRMPESFQKAIHEKKVSLAVAEELWSCPEAGKREYFIELAIEHGITKLVARQWVTDFKKELRNRENPGKRGDHSPMEYEEELIYRACDICKGPEQYKDIIEMRICRECGNRITAATKETSK